MRGRILFSRQSVEPVVADRIFESPSPSVGLVIGTFAAVPYIHLAVETWRRHYPEIPLLISDDGSPERERLRELSHSYGADFTARRQRGRTMVGDVAAFAKGLEWASGRKLDLVVKLSRRFIPLRNWVPGLQHLAYETQYATFSRKCYHFNFGFRTECTGMHVKSWCEMGPLQNLRGFVEHNEPTFVEAYIHNLAREVHKSNCAVNRSYELEHPRPSDSDAYGIWDLMAEKRTTKKPDVLWHNCDSPADYCRIAQVFGLPYHVRDFEDPNQGHGCEPR